MKANLKPICNCSDCFQNKSGVTCELLTANPSQPCPFYKTHMEAETDKMEAHNRLVKLGRRDLIEKYEFNTARRGLW